MQNPFTKSVSRRAAAIVLGSVLLVFIGFWFGPMAFRRVTNAPVAPEDVRKDIWKYLAKQTGEKDFSADLSSVTNSPTSAAQEETASSKKKNKKAPAADLVYSKYFQDKQAEASTYKALYKVVGQELNLAESLLQTADQKPIALALVMQASRCASSPTENPWLAARICEGYLWPEVALSEKADNPTEQLLSFCENAFRDAGETNNLIRNYRMVIAKSQGTQVDITRFRLSRLLEDSGQYREALECLQQMTNTNKNGYKNRVAFLQEKVKSPSR